MFILWNTEHSVLDMLEFEKLRKSNLAASSDFKCTIIQQFRDKEHDDDMVAQAGLHP